MLLVVIGDIHGNFDGLISKIAFYGLKNCTIIQLGDFGLGFSPEHKEKARLKYLNKYFKLSNITFYAIRGNHDDPSYWDNAEKYNLSNLTLLKDYETIIVNDKKILAIGGALSIDRSRRKFGKTMFSGEGVNYSAEKLKSFTDINIVVTHTAPPFITQFLDGADMDFWYMQDENLKEDLLKEQYIMTNIYQDLKLQNNITDWFFGHFHMTKFIEHEGVSFRVVDIDEIFELRETIKGD
jgi:DNA repair exonuclease SbcCD nuclease subunit